ncbi:MAG: response regulator transcription factor [Tissierellales bacterium]|nr:response regulator transcription factor [Tissierellales bacterium]
MISRILVADDEKAIGDIVKFNLEKEGFEVELCFDGDECIKNIQENNYQLILLDIMMPKKDGFEVLKEIRPNYKMPIIILTAKEDEEDKIRGLELGADDYIVKPFSMRELVARVKANLRRVDFNEDPVPIEIIETEDLTIDLSKYEVRKNGEPINLTLREFELLKHLALNRGQVFTREHLLENVWGYEYFGDIRTVDVTVRRLREKIETPDEDFKYILTKRGVGYYFRRD